MLKTKRILYFIFSSPETCYKQNTQINEYLSNLLIVLYCRHYTQLIYRQEQNKVCDLMLTQFIHFVCLLGKLGPHLYPTNPSSLFKNEASLYLPLDLFPRPQSINFSHHLHGHISARAFTVS